MSGSVSLFELQKRPEPPPLRWIRVYITEPCLSMIPAWVHPNTISISNLILCLFASLLGLFAKELESTHGLESFILRLAVSFWIFTSLIMDCLDGEHARRTKQTSKLGEVLDHSLDAATAPLIASTLCFVLGPDVITFSIGTAVTTAVYNGQLCIYSRKNLWIDPPGVDGMMGQLLLTILQVILSTVWFFLSRDSFYGQLLIIGVSIAANITQLSCWYFYLRHLYSSFGESQLGPHLRYVFTTFSFAILFPLGLITERIAVIGLVILSWRLNGHYLLHTVLDIIHRGGKLHNGVAVVPDTFTSPINILFIAMIAILGWIQSPYQLIVITTFFLLLIFLNLYDLFSNLPVLHAASQKQQKQQQTETASNKISNSDPKVTQKGQKTSSSSQSKRNNRKR